MKARSVGSLGLLLLVGMFAMGLEVVFAPTQPPIDAAARASVCADRHGDVDGVRDPVLRAFDACNDHEIEQDHPQEVLLQ